jgi:hypothetical protein
MRNRNPIFTMPVHEQTAPAGVEGMILIDAETYRHQRKQLEDMRMKVSELSGKVDTLISLATNYKNASQSQPAASLPADDPEVEALGHRIDDAIAVLQGTSTATPVQSSPQPAVTDPNAPV